MAPRLLLGLTLSAEETFSSGYLYCSAATHWLSQCNLLTELAPGHSSLLSPDCCQYDSIAAVSETAGRGGCQALFWPFSPGRKRFQKSSHPIMTPDPVDCLEKSISSSTFYLILPPVTPPPPLAWRDHWYRRSAAQKTEPLRGKD